MLPESVKIGGRTVKVFSKLNLTAPDGVEVMGYFDPNRQEIYVNASIESADVLMETFWHELIHAINDFVRFDVELAKELDDEDSPELDAFKFNETFTERFSATLLQVIKDNNLVPMV